MDNNNNDNNQGQGDNQNQGNEEGEEYEEGGEVGEYEEIGEDEVEEDEVFEVQDAMAVPLNVEAGVVGWWQAGGDLFDLFDDDDEGGYWFAQTLFSPLTVEPRQITAGVEERKKQLLSLSPMLFSGAIDQQIFACYILQNRYLYPWNNPITSMWWVNVRLLIYFYR